MGASFCLELMFLSKKWNCPVVVIRHRKSRKYLWECRSLTAKKCFFFYWNANIARLKDDIVRLCISRQIKFSLYRRTLDYGGGNRTHSHQPPSHPVVFELVRHSYTILANLIVGVHRIECCIVNFCWNAISRLCDLIFWTSSLDFFAIILVEQYCFFQLVISHFSSTSEFHCRFLCASAKFRLQTGLPRCHVCACRFICLFFTRLLWTWDSLKGKPKTVGTCNLRHRTTGHACFGVLLHYNKGRKSFRLKASLLSAKHYRKSITLCWKDRAKIIRWKWLKQPVKYVRNIPKNTYSFLKEEWEKVAWLHDCCT